MRTPRTALVVFATVHAAPPQLTGLTAGLWRPSTRSCFALAYYLFGLSSDYFRVVANLWAASFQGIQLGYEGFAPDDADSSSIRFPVQEELEPSTMLNGGSDHPPPHLEARLGGGVAVGEVIDEDDRQREAERNAQELGGRQAEDPAN